MGCHQSAWNSTQTLGGNVPNHVTANFPTSASACTSCHTITTWADGKFDHSAIGFPLTNGHANVPCSACHINGNYNLTIAPTDCGNSGCHLSTWQQTTNPVHSTSGPAFAASNCANCHTTKGWDAASFDHSLTGFALTGTHLSPTPTPCASCHLNNSYTLSSSDCMGCHLSAWNSTQTLGGNVPNHVAANFPTSASACSTCHSITVWADGKFDHSTTGFPLTNSHQMAPAGKVSTCTQCHVGGNYNLTSANTDCYGCHQAAWTSTQSIGGAVPNHVAAGFPTSLCSQCHDTIVWTDSTFTHNSTGFALTGTHATTACALCHVNNNYSLTAANTDCMGCHLSAWNSTQTLGGNVPNHVAANFPSTAGACSGCHTITTWADGKFDHSTTGWALTGGHQMVPAPGGVITACTQCHIGGNYALTSANTACYGCHLADWNSTQTLGGSVPNHVAASFPTTCDTCHTTSTWLGATFNHTWFPIPHGGESQNPPCNDCHQVSTDFTSFTCINCHTNTNAHRPGMSHPNVCTPSPSCWYQPETCYNCHKNGGGG
jgi:5-methylcytosine-specific restriction endonuclease McrA